MPAPAASSKLVAPKTWLAQAVALLRRPPLLGLVVTLLGLVVFFVKSQKLGSTYYTDGPKQWAMDYESVLNAEAMPNMVWEYFSRQWWLAVKCLLPAFLLGMVRMRGLNLLIPILAAAAALAFYWYTLQITVYWPEAQITRMGEVPTPEAFLTHTWLIFGLIFSIPLLVWLYIASTTMDKYIARSFLLPLALCVVGMVGIMIIMDLLNNANEFTKVGMDSTQVLLFYLKQFPQLLGQILDIAVLLAVLFTLTRLSRFNEIISMMGAGRSLMRVALPIIVLGAWLSYVGFSTGYVWGPAAQREREQMLTKAEAGTGTAASRNRDAQKSQTATYNVVYRNRENFRTWYVSKIPLGGKERLGLTVILEDDDNGNFYRAYYAKRSGWIPVQNHWRLFDGWIIDLTKGNSNDPIPFEKLTMENWSETPWTLASGKIAPEFLSVPELISYLRTTAGQPQERISKYQTSLLSRYAVPVRTFLLTLIGIAFGVVASRRGLLAGVAWAVGFFVIAYIGQIVLQKTAENGSLLPYVGAWAVNTLLAVTAFTMLWQRNFNRSLMSWWGRIVNFKQLKHLREQAVQDKINRSISAL